MADSTDGLDPQFMQAIQAMIAASGGKLYIESGYRSVDEQTALWNAAVAKYGSPEAARKWVAPPGHSNHNRGLAVDLGGDIELAHQLAPQFGLVFPMSWEPWHIEPVHARDGQRADPQAYTDPPPGQVNPVMDQSLGDQPDFIAASLANAMRGALDPTMTGGAVGADGAQGPAGPQGPGAVGPAGPQGMTGGGAHVDPGQGGVAPNELYKMLRGQGLPADAAAAFVAIAGRESSYNPGAYNGDASTGDDSYGLFQINLLNGGWAPFLQQHGMADPASALRTVQGSVEAAKWIYDNSKLHPWGGYKGMPWSSGTNLQDAVAASGGEVTLAQLQGLQ